MTGRPAWASGCGVARRHEAQFIDDQQFVVCHLLLKAQQPAFVTGLHQFADESGGSGEADREALLAGSQAETQGCVRLAGAARTKRDDILSALDPFAARQFQHLHLVELGDRLEVEAVQAFDRRELRRLDPAFDHPALPINHFQFDQPSEEPDMILPLGGALTGQLGVFPKEGRQLQCLEVMRQQEFGGVRHGASADTRHM